MANYIVQPGDTLSQIAKKMGVQTSAISGYKSGDPNIILPGENLSISQTSLGNFPVQNMSVIGQPNIFQKPQPLTNQPIQQPAPTPIQTQQPEQPTPLTNQPQVPTVQPEQASNTLQQFNISPEAAQSNFNVNPIGTVSDIIKNVMSQLGMPDISGNISNISSEIEKLANERDEKITEIQDNPWTSAGSKQELIQKINNQYENKIANRTNRLTLMQNAYENARQQAQFVASQAINLYDTERKFQVDQLEQATKRAEAEEIAKRKLGPLTTETVGGFTILRDAEGNIVSTMKPEVAAEATPENITYQQRTAIRTSENVDELINLAKQSPGIFGRTAAIPIPEALRSDEYRNFKAQLDTLKSNIAFGELTAMREASKTGGALGQVSDTENRLLAAALGSLEMSQSPENVVKQLRKIKDSITRWNEAVLKYSNTGTQQGSGQIDTNKAEQFRSKYGY